MTDWKHFDLDEFRCKCGCQQNYISDEFVTLLDELRELVGFPLVVTSGYRCPDHNNRVSSTGRTGPHTTGQAADISVDRFRAFRVMSKAADMGFTGIGFKQHGGGRFMHLDTLPNADGQPRPTIWSYK